VRTNDDGSIDALLNALRDDKADALVLTSSTGVEAMLEMADRRMDRSEFLNLLEGTTVVAIGPLTAKALEAAGIRVAATPSVHTSQGIVQLLRETAEGKSMFILRSDHGEPALISGLREAGAKVTEIIVYTLLPKGSDALSKLVEESMRGRIDAYAFTSSLSAETFLEAAVHTKSKEEVLNILGRSVVAAMGPPTRDKLESMGVKVDIVPASATFESMLIALSERMRN
jgi:uroporphyrinogen-III synthase